MNGSDWSWKPGKAVARAIESGDRKCKAWERNMGWTRYLSSLPELERKRVEKLKKEYERDIGDRVISLEREFGLMHKLGRLRGNL